MMNDVMVDNVMEEMSTNEPKATIHCAEGPLLEGPSGWRVVRDFGVGVMKIGNCD